MKQKFGNSSGSDFAATMKKIGEELGFNSIFQSRRTMF